MVLRGPRFAGDPILEACAGGTHVMGQGEHALDVLPQERGVVRPHSLAVLRVQSALDELGFSVGPSGLDGRFGPDMAKAVTKFKTARGISPSDPKVGVQTSTRLDDDLFLDPPELDPTFAEYSPFVVDRAVEPFIALALAGALNAPLNSWRKMLGEFALASLNSSRLIGVVTQSRTDDIQPAYAAAAASSQRESKSDTTWFADMTKAKVAPASQPPKSDEVLPTAQMVPFFNQQGLNQTFVMAGDDLVLGRSRIVQSSTGKSVAVGLLDGVAHELTHVRNIELEDAVLAVADSDATAYEDTALAAQKSAAGATPIATAQVFRSFVAEICARHVQWIVRKSWATQRQSSSCHQRRSRSQPTSTSPSCRSCLTSTNT